MLKTLKVISFKIKKGSTTPTTFQIWHEIDLFWRNSRVPDNSRKISGMMEFWNVLRKCLVTKRDQSPGNFWAHFLLSCKIKTIYPGVHSSISSLTLRPKLGTGGADKFLSPILEVLARLIKLLTDLLV